MTPGCPVCPPLFATPASPEGAMAPLTWLIVSLAFLVSAVGIALIVWGAYCSALRLIASETAAARGQAPKTDTVPAPLLFSGYLLPGLDFLLAGSVIRTTVATDWQPVAVLGGIVFARTLLTLSARWETKAATVLAEAPALVERLASPADPAGALHGTTAAEAAVRPQTVS